MGVQELANVIATAVREARSTKGMAQKGVISGDRVIGDNGTYVYDAVCPITLYDNKQVWYVLSDTNVAVIVGD